jgi:hypothetical protein
MSAISALLRAGSMSVRAWRFNQASSSDIGMHLYNLQPELPRQTLALFHECPLGHMQLASVPLLSLVMSV